MPFGEDLNTSGTTDKRRFTTYERDSETSLDYAVNRLDNVSVGRFSAVDPMASSAKTESPQTWNRYIYSSNDPINMLDPLGLWAFGLLDNRVCDPSSPTVLLDGIELFTGVNCAPRLPVFIPPIQRNPPPLSQPISCSATLRTSGPVTPPLTSADPSHNMPNLGNTLGEKEGPPGSMGDPLGTWTFLHEINVGFPLTRGISRNRFYGQRWWRFYGSITLLGESSPREFTSGKEWIYDGPNPGFDVWYGDVFYATIDGPSFQKTLFGNKIVDGDIYFKFLFYMVDRRLDMEACSLEFTLHLKIRNEVGRWTVE